VPRPKQTRIGRVASLYLVRYDDAPPECRFDVLGMDAVGGAWRFTLIRNAFVLGS
jgi:Holliday junction resolvase-like predicted endonuclease